MFQGLERGMEERIMFYDLNPNLWWSSIPTTHSASPETRSCYCLTVLQKILTFLSEINLALNLSLPGWQTYFIRVNNMINYKYRSRIFFNIFHLYMGREVHAFNLCTVTIDLYIITNCLFNNVGIITRKLLFANFVFLVSVSFVYTFSNDFMPEIHKVDDRAFLLVLTEWNFIKTHRLHENLGLYRHFGY